MNIYGAQYFETLNFNHFDDFSNFDSFSMSMRIIIWMQK